MSHIEHRKLTERKPFRSFLVVGNWVRLVDFPPIICLILHSISGLLIGPCFTLLVRKMNFYIGECFSLEKIALLEVKPSF